MPMMPDTQQPSETSKDAETSNAVPVEPTAQDIAATGSVSPKLTMSSSTSSSSMGKPVRDSSWLELDVCRDFMRGYSCPRGDQCRFAHPEQTVLTKENKVTCCYDFLKDRCFREHCKYFHPPLHIKERLVTAGKQFGAMMSNMYLLPAGASPYHHPPVLGFDGCIYTPAPPGGLLPAPVMSTFGAITDRVHICPEFLRGQCNVELCPFVHPEPKVRQNFDSTVTICHDYMRGNCAREWCRYYHPPQHITTQLNPQPALQSFVTPQGVFIAPTAAVPASMPAPVFPPNPVMYPTPISITGAAQQTSVNPFTVTSPVAPVTSVPFIPAAAGPMSAMPVMMAPYSSPVSTVVPVQSLASPLSVIQPPSPPNMDLVNGHKGIPTE